MGEKCLCSMSLCGTASPIGSAKWWNVETQTIINKLTNRARLLLRIQGHEDVITASVQILTTEQAAEVRVALLMAAHQFRMTPVYTPTFDEESIDLSSWVYRAPGGQVVLLNLDWLDEGVRPPAFSSNVLISDTTNYDRSNWGFCPSMSPLLSRHLENATAVDIVRGLNKRTALLLRFTGNVANAAAFEAGEEVDPDLRSRLHSAMLMAADQFRLYPLYTPTFANDEFDLTGYTNWIYQAPTGPLIGILFNPTNPGTMRFYDATSWSGKNFGECA